MLRRHILRTLDEAAHHLPGVCNHCASKAFRRIVTDAEKYVSHCGAGCCRLPRNGWHGGCN